MEGVVCIDVVSRCAVHNWMSRLIFEVVGCDCSYRFWGISSLLLYKQALC